MIQNTLKDAGLAIRTIPKSDAIPEREPLLNSSYGSVTRKPTSDNNWKAASDTDDSTSEKGLSLRHEAHVLVRYSLPLIPTYLLQYAFQLVVIFVASQLSTDELAGLSLGITTANIIGYAVFEGCSTALDTLCSQAYGAGRLTDVGMHTIRFTLFSLVISIPIALLWLFSEQILLLLHVPSTDLATHAGSFLRLSIIGLPGYAAFEAGKRFLQAQGNFTGGLFTLALCLPINIGLTWVLVIPAGMGVAGAALAAAITNNLRPLLLAAYSLCIVRSTLQCWPSKEEYFATWNKDWRVMIKLAIPGALTTLAEWSNFEILTFCTSYVSTAALAAQTFLGTAATLVWHIPFSASIASSTRLGQLIGAGRTDVLRRLAKWYSVVFFLLGLVNAALAVGVVFFTREYLIHDPEVAEIVMQTLPFLAMFVVFDSNANWPHSIARGIGWQKVAAWVTVLVNFLYAVPLSIFLELGPPRIGISGLWIGLGTGLGLVTVIEAIVIWRIWNKHGVTSVPSDD